MSQEVFAALIGIGGTAVLALVANVVAQIYLAGRLVEKVSGLQHWKEGADQTIKGLVIDVAKIKGKEQLA